MLAVRSVGSLAALASSSIIAGFRHSARRKVPEAMRFTRTALLLAISLFTFATAQQPLSQPAGPSATVQSHHEDEALAETTPVVTHHQISVAGKPLKYTATAGRFVLKPERDRKSTRLNSSH